jgi:hypothetical protein
LFRAAGKSVKMDMVKLPALRILRGYLIVITLMLGDPVLDLAGVLSRLR